MDDALAYLSFFGLHEQPFAPTADPAYFYATGEHKECLFRLWSSIDQRQGIVAVLGSYGTGKTTLLRKLIAGMRADPDRYHSAVIGSPIPSWTSFALLESIVAQFGLRPRETSFVAYMEALNQSLLAQRDRICTLIIDDAQNLNKRGQIELLRLVQNLETQQHKLLNLVLFAQLEWIQVLDAVPNFAQRIGTTYTLEPIQYGELRHLINFRLQQAGAGQGAGPEFSDGALRAIHSHAEGSPRLIVTLCRNALLLAARVQTRLIDEEIIRHTIEKTTLPKKGRPLAEAQAEPAPMAPPVPAAGSTPAMPLSAAPPAGQAKTRDQRAADLLLRAARGRRGGGTEAS